MGCYPQAITYLMRSEGGYVNDPDDPGGETNYGICRRDHPNIDIAALTLEQAEQIYRDQYWNFDGLRSCLLAIKLFDWCVNLEGNGHQGEAIRALQIAINLQFPGSTGVTVDGCYGSHTETMANRAEPTLLVSAMMRIIQSWRADRIRANPTLAKFEEGWRRRDQRTPWLAQQTRGVATA